MLASERRGRISTVSASIALALIALVALSARAQATELLYWDNYGADPDNAAFANIDGSGGGVLNTGGEAIDSPEGQAYDTVTNRLFLTTGSGVDRHILAINLDGSGASRFTAPGAPVEEPEGVAVDPASRTIYWENTKGGGSLAWAKLDGSAGGLLSTNGITVSNACCRIAVDPVGGRLYFDNGGAIGYVNLNNTGGGELNLTGASIEPGGEGIVVDPAGGRLYYLGAKGPVEGIGFANLNNTGGGDVSLGGAPMKASWGLALDPALSRLYWGNEGNNEERPNAFGFVSRAGAGGGISIATAPLANPQDPVIIKSPTGTGAPTIARNAKVRSELSCSNGTWGADYPGSFVYQAPRTFVYQWLRNGAPIGGATATTFTAKSPGTYTCTVTATNQAGTGAQTSAAISVKAAKIKLTTKKKAKAEAGDLVKFKVKAVNQGDLKPKNAKLCVTLPKNAKDDLKAPKCKKAALQGQAKKTFTIKVKVKGGADIGTDKLTFKVKGAAGKAAKAKIVVE
ncbi:MAG TPA: hypothetical protein VLK37_00570 [Solirubrobacterales bacterium]|nr:hypothetical protein [Solirubrobacterales bacterium]